MPASSPDTAAAGAGATPQRLRLAGLHKRYGERVALKSLDLTLAPRSFVALLGPNGAGKSTLFQLLTGLFAPDAGEVEVDGLSLARQTRQALARIGVVFQQMSLDLDLSVRRNLQFHAQLHGLPAALARTRIEAAAETFGLAKDLQRAVRELSGGNRRKVELARALLHRPALILMDEPTVGLDPKSRRDLLAAIKDDVAQRGSTVLWATHLVEEAQAADRVLVLHRGVLLADGAPDAVTAQLGGGSLEEAFVKATA
ncbi:ATP-binding cassette domain-containing protein [Azohydromonas aeria]|uniref:ATP-binding cassette domain-containing protein n=1 Tax=Azohydromonas aeria TaxID=2590212 RepID=UPI0035BEDF36